MSISLMMIVAMAAADPPPVPAAVQIIEENNVFVLRSADGAKPLYTFDRDVAGKPTCLDRCAAAWPPLQASAGARPVGAWTIVSRADGSSQWAFRGKPVYSFSHDANSKAGGDGMGGVWHLLPTTPSK